VIEIHAFSKYDAVYLLTLDAVLKSMSFLLSSQSSSVRRTPITVITIQPSI